MTGYRASFSRPYSRHGIWRVELVGTIGFGSEFAIKRTETKIKERYSVRLAALASAAALFACRRVEGTKGRGHRARRRWELQRAALGLISFTRQSARGTAEPSRAARRIYRIRHSNPNPNPNPSVRCDGAETILAALRRRMEGRVRRARRKRRSNNCQVRVNKLENQIEATPRRGAARRARGQGARYLHYGLREDFPFPIRSSNYRRCVNRYGCRLPFSPPPPRRPTPRVYFSASARRNLAKLFGRHRRAQRSHRCSGALAHVDGQRADAVRVRPSPRPPFRNPHGRKCAARLARTAPKKTRHERRDALARSRSKFQIYAEYRSRIILSSRADFQVLMGNYFKQTDRFLSRQVR